MRLLLHVLSDDLRSLLLFQWLDVSSLAMLDVAVSSKSSRQYWMTLLGSLRSTSMDKMNHSALLLMWLIQRGICVSRVQMKANAWREPECDLSRLNKSELVYLGLDGCSSVTDECILKAVKGQIEDYGNDLNGDNKLTDAGVSALENVYGQLKSTVLRWCDKVTDAADVSALSCGCGKLQSIDLSNCSNITDAGVSALGRGCGQLQSINLTR